MDVRDTGAGELALVLDVVDDADDRLDHEQNYDHQAKDCVGVTEQLVSQLDFGVRGSNAGQSLPYVEGRPA